MSSLFWQLGWRSSPYLGLVVLRQRKRAKAEQCGSMRSFCSGVANVANWFHQNKGQNTVHMLLYNIHNHALKSVSSNTHSTCVCPAQPGSLCLQISGLDARRGNCPDDSGVWACVSLCVWQMWPHPSLSAYTSWGTLRLLPTVLS